MDFNELKYKLKNQTKCICLGIGNRELSLKVEKILLSNGFMWRASKNKSYLETKNYESIILYTNFAGNEPFKLSVYQTLFIDGYSDFIITEDNIELISQIFSPTYNPRIIDRSI